LGEGASDAERAGLSLFKYSGNDTYVHSDEALMPKARAAWTSWNYIGKNSHAAGAGGESDHDSKPVFVTYWLNKLQHLDHPRNVFVSLNPHKPPDPSKTFARLEYSHPQVGRKRATLLQFLAAFCGIFLCGAS